jgi:5-methylthioadenosine/S-adenosylhomocysteine deaminase
MATGAIEKSIVAGGDLPRQSRGNTPIAPIIGGAGGFEMESIRAAAYLADPDQPLIESAVDVLIEGGTIAAVEQIPREALKGVETTRLLMPALTNAHDHGRGLRTLSYGAEDHRLEEWLIALSRHPSVDPYLVAAAAFGRMVETGVGALNHCHVTQDPARLFEEAAAVSRAAKDVGLHVAFAVPFGGRNPLIYGDPTDLLASLPEPDRSMARAQIDRLRSSASVPDRMARLEALEHDFFHLQLGPIAPQWVPEPVLAEIADISARTGWRVHMHLLETSRQREWATATYGKGGLVGYLDRIGLLSPRLSVAHAVWLDPSDCALLAERGVTVSINLSSNMRLRSGAPPVAMMRAAGLRFAIGLDGMSFDDDEDMLREARLLWRLHDGVGQQPLPVAELLEALCRTGREAIVGDATGGRIAPGAPADVLAIDLSRIVHDRIGSFPLMPLFLSRVTRSHVDALWVNGRKTVEGGRCLGVDLPAIEDALLIEARAAVRVDDAAVGRIDRLQQAVQAHYESHGHCGC